MTPEELGAAIREKLRQGLSFVEVPLSVVRDAGLGYPLGAENGHVVSWWGHWALVDWMDGYRLRILPLKVSDKFVTFISK